MTTLLPCPPFLQALARFAFGMGTLQMLICTVAFIAVGLPPGTALFSQVGRRSLMACSIHRTAVAGAP